MQFTLGFAVLAATLAAVRGASIAAPVLERAEDLEARAAQVDGHIYICTDDNFSGSCTNYGFTANQCSNFPSGFQDNISSVGPDKGWVCTLFINYDCNSNEGTYDVQNPGFSHLNYGNDKFSSLRCFRIN